MTNAFVYILSEQEISTNDGILLKKGPASFLNEIFGTTTGSLSLVHYSNNSLYIEWKPNDHYLIADADAQEQVNTDFALPILCSM